MPELAEVEFYRRQWDCGMGQKILRVEIHPEARIFRGADVGQLGGEMPGCRVVRSLAHGKQMVFDLGRFWLGIHLGMTGELLIGPRGHVVGKHDHLVIRQHRQTLIFRDPRMFGRVRWEAAAGEPVWWRELPPAVLSDGFTVGRVREALGRHARAPLKAILLHQEYFPGIGNWMADEILWRLGWHPALPGAAVKEKGAPALRRRTRELCREALRIIAPDWSDPPMDWLFNHRWKAGGFCPRDQTPLLREEVGGRTTCWCPTCQKSG